MRPLLVLMTVVCFCVGLPLTKFFARKGSTLSHCSWNGEKLMPGEFAAVATNGECMQMRCVPYTDGTTDLIIEMCSSIGNVPDERYTLPFPQCCPYPDLETGIVDDMMLSNVYDEY